MVSIRAATDADIATMQAIELDAGRRFIAIGMPAVAGAPVPTEAELTEPIEAGRAWVAEDPDGTVVGYAVAGIVDGHAHLAQVSVRMASGGGGVGHALVGVVEQWGRSQGFESLTLTTFRDVTFNGPWYERLGFSPLPDAKLGPELQAIRAAEVDAGFDAEGPRLAMGRAISPRHF